MVCVCVCSMHVSGGLYVQVNETKLDLKLFVVSGFINANWMGGFLFSASSLACLCLLAQMCGLVKNRHIPFVCGHYVKIRTSMPEI